MANRGCTPAKRTRWRSTGGGVTLNGVPFTSPRLSKTLARCRRARRRRGRGRRGPGARSGGPEALAGRKAGRVLLPRSLRLRDRRAPGDDDRGAALRLGRKPAHGRASALQSRVSRVGDRRAAAAAGRHQSLAAADAGSAGGRARVGDAAAEEVAAGGLRRHEACRPRAAADRSHPVRELFVPDLPVPADAVPARAAGGQSGARGHGR